MYSRRRELNIGLACLSRRVGVSEASLRRWELRDGACVSGKRLRRLARGLRVKPEALQALVPSVRRIGPAGGALPKSPTAFGELIQERRLILGMSRERLSKQTGFSLMTIVRWEHGRHHAFPKPHNRKIVAIRLSEPLKISAKKIIATLSA